MENILTAKYLDGSSRIIKLPQVFFLKDEKISGSAENKIEKLLADTGKVVSYTLVRDGKLTLNKKYSNVV